MVGVSRGAGGIDMLKGLMMVRRLKSGAML